MEEKKIAKFPLPCYGRIPNFFGAEKAAENLKKLKEWKDAKTIKINPDSPQRKVREIALKKRKNINNGDSSIKKRIFNSKKFEKICF